MAGFAAYGRRLSRTGYVTHTVLRRLLALAFTWCITAAATQGATAQEVSSTRSAVLVPGVIPAGSGLPDSLIPQAARLRPGVPFNVESATEGWLATVPAETRVRSDAYYEGGYWIQLWSFLLSAAIALGFLQLGWSRRLRDWAERRTRNSWVATLLYYAGFVLAATVIAFPFTVYTGFVREHAYGLATQTFGGWLRDQAVGLVVSLVLGGAAIATLYAVLRRLPRSWPMWGAVVSIAFLVFGAVIAPVFIAPLFNRYTPLSEPSIREPILRLARANGVAADNVWVVDASRQSTRISANVSGLFGTERITLNDNLLRRASLPEIEAVMGHEIGHYVLHHVYDFIVFLTLVVLGGFALLRWGFDWTIRRWGTRWGIRDAGDPAGMPLLWLILLVYGFVTAPLTSWFNRSHESAADLFALNAARQPDAQAIVLLKLADYRKLEPGPVEEALFFDHPSGRSRVRMAMQWKAEHPPSGATPAQ
jgi:STE24 endopeptidase